MVLDNIDLYDFFRYIYPGAIITAVFLFYGPIELIQFDSLYGIYGGYAKEIEDIKPYLELIRQKMGDDEEYVQKKKKINIAPYLKLIERRMNE